MRLMELVLPDKPEPKTSRPVQRVALDDLQHASARAAPNGSILVYTPVGDRFQPTNASYDQVEAALAEGCLEVVNLSDDLILARTDVHQVPESAANMRWQLDYSGWLFLHFRLDGLSREVAPDGTETTMGGQSFLLTATRGGHAGTREVLGENWRSVGIACKPSFVSRELQLKGKSIPSELRRFQDDNDEVGFWFAGELSKEMSDVATALLHPVIHRSVQAIYMRAKAVELVCLALDKLREPQAAPDIPIKLSRHDVSCLHFARQVLDISRKRPALQELARRVGLNRNKLAVGFKHVFGATVGAYHRTRRLEAAREALLTSDRPIGTIAYDAGYRDAGSFSKAFRKHFGVLPSEVPRGTLAASGGPGAA